MARINIVSNISNGVGLQRDYELLRTILLTAGHQVCGVQFNAAHRGPQVDLNIFIETVVPQLLSLGIKNWLIPNPEWFQPQFLSVLGQFQKVLCKTADAMKIFRQISKDQGLTLPVELIGWESRDFYDPAIPREHKFLHVAGNSNMKNTQAILYAWGTGRMRLPVTVVSEVYSSGSPVTNVNFRRRVTDEELKILMNSHRFHLCTSHYEGWGHALHESLAVGAVILATAQPPMDESPAAVRVGVQGARAQCLAQTWSVSGPDLLVGAQAVEAMSGEELENYSAIARSAFLEKTDFFRRKIQEVLSEI